MDKKTDVTRDEKNRVIAEWLGWKWNGYTRWHSPACQRDEENCGGILPNFFTSEEASALALERMPCVTLYRALNTLHWVCNPDGFSGSTHIDAEDPDRKTAIAEAAYLLAVKAKEQG